MAPKGRLFFLGPSANWVHVVSNFRLLVRFLLLPVPRCSEVVRKFSVPSVLPSWPGSPQVAFLFMTVDGLDFEAGSWGLLFWSDVERPHGHGSKSKSYPQRTSKSPQTGTKMSGAPIPKMAPLVLTHS